MSTIRSPCPQCDRGPRDRALAVTTDERGIVSYCHRCGFVHAENQDVRSHPRLRPIPRERALDWSARADAIWRRTRSLAGTLGEVYLSYRGCMSPPRESHLRYLPGDDHYPPSLCAAVTDVRTAVPITLHFTRLAENGKGKAGTDCDKLLLRGHRKRGGCIRLWPDNSVTHGLALAEGIETALAAAHAFEPVWSTVDAGNLSTFPVLAGIDALTIFADHDDAGLAAARECASRWRDASRSVRVLTPRIAGHDTADEVKP